MVCDDESVDALPVLILLTAKEHQKSVHSSVRERNALISDALLLSKVSELAMHLQIHRHIPPTATPPSTAIYTNRMLKSHLYI